jgi:prepilin-type N-terminal cleavage/methylation domain-containing protein
MIHAHRGFTLTELIAVITIIVILLAVSIPTFRSTMAASDSSNVETQLRLALLSARNAALHSERGADTAAVFTYQPGGRTNILICEQVGTITDRSNSRNVVVRDIFVPVPAFEPVQLTPGWMVSGLALAGTLPTNSDPGWYEDAPDRSFDTNQRNWVFPETEFFDALVTDDGDNRQTFMIRFLGGIGSVAVGDVREALVVSPRATAIGRESGIFKEVRLDAAVPDVATVVRRALNNSDYLARSRGSNNDPFTQLFGNESGDTILTRSVEQIGLYKTTDLANGMGIKLNRDTGVFYANEDEPKIDLRGNSADFHSRLRWWIEGNTTAARNDRDDDWIINDEDDEPIARLYTVQRYTGVLQPVPLLDFAGASR